MIIEPPWNLNVPEDDDATAKNDYHPFRWRHLKYVCLSFINYVIEGVSRQACGENVRGYGNRMDNIWAMRAAYTEAVKIKSLQDEYCAKAEAGLWHELVDQYPQALQYEALVDVLRGKVKVCRLIRCSVSILLTFI